MVTIKTTPKQIQIDSSLVRRLIAEQFPKWANLPIQPVKLSGWDNRAFHLGEHMTVRLPSAERYALQVEKEHRWLPKLAPLLPLPIPTPLAMGNPSQDYPWHWSVYEWINGENATRDRIKDLSSFAKSLAEFLKALQEIESTGGPPAGPHNFHRGGALAYYENETREAITALGNQIDADAINKIWEKAVSTRWSKAPVWVHGDVSLGNLLVDKQGRLGAVIDFGILGIGDPACDLCIAWTFFEGESRSVFRKAISLDDATWARSRGWALWKALIVLAGHAAPVHEKEVSKRVLDVLVAEHYASEPNNVIEIAIKSTGPTQGDQS